MSTTARLFVDPIPEMGDGATRYTVDCKWGTTRLWWTSGTLKLSERHLITVLLQRHEDECGKCNLGRLWREHGDPELKRMVDRTWDRLRAHQVAERRN
jgi:23S rRNA A2030 N6-methylase RlmJ